MQRGALVVVGRVRVDARADVAPDQAHVPHRRRGAQLARAADLVEAQPAPAAMSQFMVMLYCALDENNPSLPILRHVPSASLSCTPSDVTITRSPSEDEHAQDAS